MLFYFLWGSLLWQGLGLEGDDIIESKQGITMLALFHGLLLELHMFFNHCHMLPFDGRPNYDHFCYLFDNFLVQEGLQSNVVFDWDVAGAKSWGHVSEIIDDISA
jgi:hypothetical protein